MQRGLVLTSCIAATLTRMSVSASLLSTTAERARPLENVWNYPRPAILDSTTQHEIEIIHDDVLVIRTTDGARVLETSHPPTIYVPINQISEEVKLVKSGGSGSFCEWKGHAQYFDLIVNGKRFQRVAWGYPNPSSESFAPIADMVSFYCSKVDTCKIDGEISSPQEGDYYGGWVNSWITGGQRGMKGGPGTRGW